MTDFAPNGYKTLQQFLNSLVEDLDGGDIQLAHDRHKLLRADLYAGAVTASFVDSNQVQEGLVTIDRNFWATDAGGRAIETGRYYPLGEHLAGNPYILGSGGAPFFIKSQKPRRKPAARGGLPQKVGPKVIKDRIAAAYSEEFPQGHSAASLSLAEAKIRIERALGEDFSVSTFRAAKRIAEQGRGS